MWLPCASLLLFSTCAVLLSTLAPLVSADALDQLIYDREAEVKNLAQRVSQLMSGQALCDATMRSTCASTCNYDSCRSSPDTATCLSQFGTPAVCNAGSNQRASNEESSIKLAPGVDMTSVDRTAKHSVIADICATKRLDTVFRAHYSDSVASDTPTRWQYFGSVNGMYRFFPGNTWGQSGGRCSAYDPRERGWYVAASSGAKRVTIIIDTSGSMGSNNRMSLAKSAANSVLKTLTNADTLAVVDFSSAAVAWRSVHAPATAANLAYATQFVNRMTPGGLTYYAKALDVAYDVIQSSQNNNVGTNACRDVILFLTDGEPSDASSTIYQAAERIKSLVPNLVMFTYSVSSSISGNLREIPFNMACRNGGVWAGITDVTKIREQMVGYHNFLSTGFNRTEPVWVEPYTDALGLGQVITVSAPVFDQTLAPPYLLGVVGVDVLFDDFKATGEASSTILERLVERSSQCSEVGLTPCQLTALQAQSGAACNATLAAECNMDELTDASCGASVQSLPANTFTCQTQTVYTTTALYANRTCCDGEIDQSSVDSGDSDSGNSSSSTGSVLASLGSVLGVVVVIIVAGFVYKVVKAKHRQQQASAPAPSPAPAPAPAAASHVSPAQQMYNPQDRETMAYYNNPAPGAPMGQPGYTGYPPGQYPAQGQFPPGQGYPPAGQGYPPAGGPPAGPPPPAYV